MNACYERFTELLLNEAKRSTENKPRKRKHTKVKRYWDSELSIAWQLMHNAESKFRKLCKIGKRNSVVEQARVVFKNKRMIFDKLLKREKEKCLL